MRGPFVFAFHLKFWVWVVYILTVCAGAFRYGGVSERVGAAAFLGAWLATLAIIKLQLSYQAGVSLVDIALLAVLVGLALKSSRYWPLWAAGFHLLAVMTHWARQLDPTVGDWSYLTAGIIWGYLPVLALAYGTWGVWRERRQLAAMTAAPIADPGATLR